MTNAQVISRAVLHTLPRYAGGLWYPTGYILCATVIVALPANRSDREPYQTIKGCPAAMLSSAPCFSASRHCNAPVSAGTCAF